MPDAGLAHQRLVLEDGFGVGSQYRFFPVDYREVVDDLVDDFALEEVLSLQCAHLLADGSLPLLEVRHGVWAAEFPRLLQAPQQQIPQFFAHDCHLAPGIWQVVAGLRFTVFWATFLTGAGKLTNVQASRTTTVITCTGSGSGGATGGETVGPTAGSGSGAGFAAGGELGFGHQNGESMRSHGRSTVSLRVCERDSGGVLGAFVPASGLLGVLTSGALGSGAFGSGAFGSGLDGVFGSQ